MAKVAFLGLGVMGFPMAGHLVAKGGHEVTVFNRTPAKAKAWAEKFGGKTAATPEAAAEGQDFVMACVGNDDDLRAITIGAGGAFAGMKARVQPSSIIRRPPLRSRANSMPKRTGAASVLSTLRSPGDRPAPKTAFSP